MDKNPLNKFNINKNIEEINLIDQDFQFINFSKQIKRNKNKLILLTSVGAFISLITSLSIPKSWQGFFEIIVSNSEKKYHLLLNNLN